MWFPSVPMGVLQMMYNMFLGELQIVYDIIMKGVFWIIVMQKSYRLFVLEKNIL